MMQKPSSQTPCKELPYTPPTGPIGQGHNGPGLGGTNYGTAGSQGANSPNHANTGGSPVPWINGSKR